MGTASAHKWHANRYGPAIFIENYPRDDQTDNPAHRMIAQVLDDENAALVAAAPVMLRALQAVAQQLHGSDCPEAYLPASVRALVRNAINEATEV